MDDRAAEGKQPAVAAAAGAEEVELYRLLLHSLHEGVFVAQDHRWVFVNRALAEQLGTTPEALAGAPFTRVVHPDDLPRFTDRFDRRVAGGAPPGHYEVRLLRDDGGAGEPLVAMLRATRATYRGRPAVLGTVMDVTARRRAEAALAASERRLRALVETAVDGIIVIDAAGAVRACNPACERLFGYPAAELVGRDVSALMPRPHAAAHAGHLARYLATGERRIIGVGRELVGRRADGSTFPMELSVGETGQDGERAFVGIVRDVTERKRAEERQALLLAELNHRAKNMLALAQAIARQTAAGAASPAAFVATFQGRLGALATAHDLLTASGWRGAGLRALLERALAPHRHGDPGRLEIAAGDDPPLAPALAQDLCLAVHELATNAAKHGALSVPDGRVRLTAEAAPTGAARELRLLWREQGGPRVERPPRARGFGMTLLERALAHQHRGRVELDWRPEGLACAVRLSLPGGEGADRG